MENGSVAKIVQQITETLSDAVAQLVVLVVALQEQNAEMPPTLPTAAQAVCGASGTLVSVARALAEEEYSDFPDICGQILGAADGVEQAAAAMITAVQAVATARDRQAGWSQLVEYCKIIAGKTIILLQIVYGADLYRLFACSDQTNDTLNRLDTKLAISDPQAFADLAGEAATRANQLGEYVKAKAADTDSPMLQASLAETAGLLQQDANDLIETANALLQDPNNAKGQQALNLQLAKVRAHIKKVTDPLQEDLQTVAQDLERLQNATKGDKQTLDTLFAAPKPAPGQKSPSQDMADEPAVLLAYRGAGLSERIETAARRGDAAAVAAATTALDEANRQLQAGTALAASTLDDPVRKRRLQASMEELEQLAPLHRDAVQRTLKDPKKQKELHQASQQLKTKYDDIAETLRPGAATAAALADYKKASEKAKNAAEKGDAASLEAALEELQETTANLQRRVDTRVAEVDDPITRREVTDALGDLLKLTPLKVTAAKRLAKAPRDRQAQNDLADTFERATPPLAVIATITDPMGDQEIIVAASQGEKESDMLYTAARDGDKDRVSEAAKRLTRSNIKLAKQARARAARLEDPARRRELLSAVDDLERLLPEQLNAASEAASNPKDQGKADQLLALTELVLAKVAQVEGSVESAAPVVAAAKREKKKLAGLNDALTKGDPKDIESALKALQNANDVLLMRGREEQNNKVDPHRRRDLSNALDELERLLPLQVKAVKDAKEKPRDAAAKKAVLEINGLVGSAVDDVVRKAIPAPKDRAASAVANGLDELDRLLEAVKREDPARAALSIRAIAATGVKLGDEGRNQAQATDDGIKRKGILDAVDELERLLPLQMASAREAVTHPKDKAKQAKLEEMNERLKDVAGAVLMSMADNADEAAASAAHQQAKEAERLSSAALAGDAHAVEMAAKALAKKQPKLAQQARARAAKTDDPDRKRDILDALEMLEALIPRQISAAKDATSDPDDAQKRQQLEDTNAELADAFKQLSEVMLPTDGARALVAAVDKENQAMEQLRSAVQKGDAAQGEASLSELEDALRQITQTAKTEAIHSDDDPKGRRNLNDAISELEALLMKLRPLASTALANPKDKKALKALTDDLDKIATATDKIMETSKAAALAEAQKQEKAVEKLALAARNNDPQAIAATARSLARRAPKLAEQARAQARKTDDATRKKAILAVVDELERLLPGQMAASLAVANNPDDDQAKKALDNAMADYTGLLSTLEAAIRPDTKDKVPEAAERELANLARLVEQTKKGDARGAEETLRQLDQDNDLLAQHGRARAARDTTAKSLREAVNDLENLMALVRDCARAGLKTPNDKRSQEDLEEFVKRLGDRVNELAEHMDPTYRNKKEREVARAAADLESIVPRLNDACERLTKNPGDRKTIEELEEIITGSQIPLEVLERSKQASLEEEVMQSRMREREALSTLEDEARRGNLDGIETEARKAAMAQETFLDRARRRAEEAKDPSKKKRILDAITDLERLLPETVRAARRLAQNPSDAASKRDLAELSLLMLAAMEQGEREIVPSVEAVALETAKRLPSETDKLLASVQSGDERRATGALKELDELMARVLEQATSAATLETDPKTRKDLQDAVSSLEALLSTIRPNVITATRRPGDRKSQALLTEAARGLVTSLNSISDALKAEAVVEAQLQEATISRLSSAAKRKDPRELAEATKTMAANHKKLTENAREEASRSDPARKRQLLEMVAELDNLLPRQVIAVKESLQNPGNEEKLEALGRAVDNSRAAVCNLQDALHPTPATAADKLAARELAELSTLQSFARRGDRVNVETSIARLTQNHEEAKRQANEASARAPNPHDKAALAAAVGDLDALFATLSRTARDAAASPSDKQKQLALEDSIHQMRKPIDTIQTSIKDSTTKSHFTAATAIIAGVRPRKMDARSLLDAASALAGHLNSLASDVSLQAHKNRDTSMLKATAALDLDSLLSQLDKIAADSSKHTGAMSPASASASMSSLIGDLEMLAQASAPKATSLEASINQVAESLQRSRASNGNNVQRSRVAGGEATTGRHTANIGSELAKLADACKGGQRQQFLISARAISTFVRSLSVDVKVMGDKCPDPELKERLLKCMQALQNYSIQLKILASVKAASNTPDPDADQQLAILTQNLGQMLTGTISAVNVAHLKYHVGTV